MGVCESGTGYNAHYAGVEEQWHTMEAARRAVRNDPRSLRKAV